MKEYLYQKPFVDVVLEDGIIQFLWKDCTVSEEEWLSFREECFSHFVIEDMDVLYVLNYIEKQDIMNLFLMGDLSDKFFDFLKSGKRIFVSIVTGDNFMKEKEADFFIDFNEHVNMNVKVFRSIANGLDWLKENNG